MNKSERLSRIERALGPILLKGFDFNRLTDIFLSEEAMDGCPITRLSARSEWVDSGMSTIIRNAQPLVSLPFIADEPMEVDSRVHWFLRLDCFVKLVHVDNPDALNRSLEIEVTWPSEMPKDGLSELLGRLIASESTDFARSELGQVVNRIACYASVLGTRGLLSELQETISNSISNGAIQESGERDPAARRAILGLPDVKYDVSWEFTIDAVSSPFEAATTTDYYRSKQPPNAGAYLVIPFDDRPIELVDLEAMSEPKGVEG